MKVFADFHHSGLYYSLHLLLEKRLGWELYRPCGMEWYEDNWWDIAKPYNNSIDTAKQFLEIRNDYQPIDGTNKLNTVKRSLTSHYEIEELSHGFTHKALTFEQFMGTDIDIIIASIPDHYIKYVHLRDLFKKKAHVVCQMGNMFNEVPNMLENGTIKNLMASTSSFRIPDKAQAIFYHQEVDQEIFTATPPPAKQTKVTSFVNCLPLPDLYENYKNFLYEYDFKAYGASCPDGFVHTTEDMASVMKESAWGYHVKPMGDGFGHVWFDWGFIGRPIITRSQDYHDKLGGEIFEHGVTGIDLDRGTLMENVGRIRKYSEPEQHAKLCDAILKRTHEKVNYDAEQEKMLHFFENLRY